MSITRNTTCANAILDGFDALFNSATLEIRSGAAPGAGNSPTGTVLATVPLPADALAPASGGTKGKSGTWQDSAADASGTAGHFRLSNGTSVIEGTVTATGGGGDMTVDNINFVAGQPFTVTSFTFSV